MMHAIMQLAYLVATALFIFALHWMNDPKTARRGVYRRRRRRWRSRFWPRGLAAGSRPSRLDRRGDRRRLRRRRSAVARAADRRAAADRAVARLRRPGRGPRRHGRSTTCGCPRDPASSRRFRMVAIVAEVILGFLTFTGSLMAAGKLQEVKWIPQRPVTYPGQNVSNIGLLFARRWCWASRSCCIRPARGPPLLFPVIIAAGARSSACC